MRFIKKVIAFDCAVDFLKYRKAYLYKTQKRDWNKLKDIITCLCTVTILLIRLVKHRDIKQNVCQVWLHTYQTFVIALSLKASLHQRFTTGRNGGRERCSSVNWSVSARPQLDDGVACMQLSLSSRQGQVIEHNACHLLNTEPRRNEEVQCSFSQPELQYA